MSPTDIFTNQGFGLFTLAVIVVAACLTEHTTAANIGADTATTETTTATDAPWTPSKLGTVSYVGKDDNDYAIIYAQFEAVLDIPYEVKRESEDDGATIKHSSVNVPGGILCSHNQTKDCKSIALSCSWPADSDFPDELWMLDLTYSVTSDPKKGDLCQTDKQGDWDSFEYALTAVKLSYFVEENYFPQALMEGDEIETGNSTFSLFGCDSGSSYKCESETDVDVVDTSDPRQTQSFTLKLTNYQVEAFQIGSEKETAQFDTAKTCDLDDDGSSLVPIIVGCVLAGLIILTLIAYFIGRWHHNRQSAYQAL